jgi:hypothetical protein
MHRRERDPAGRGQEAVADIARQLTNDELKGDLIISS